MAKWAVRWQCARSVLALAGLSLACEPSLDVGQWTCATAPLSLPSPDSGMLPASREPLVPTWETSFEDGFCGYQRARGFCYSDPDAEYRLVETPARSGRFAAAFTIQTGSEPDSQARCVREGLLPQSAYYGAWFFIPRGITNEGNWNLMHVQGGIEGGDLHGLWDVSIGSGPDGELLPRLFGFLGAGTLEPEQQVLVPQDEWFELVFHLQRGADADGAVALYLNGNLIVERSGITTDDSDWGQWYVGNLATRLTPSEATLYVDDVSIHQVRQIGPQ